jgi:hypothetical protein
LTLARRGPTLATLVRPRSEDLFLWSEDLFVRCRLRSDFSRFDPASPGVGGDGPNFSNFGPPTFSNFARGVDRRPFCGGARRCGVGAAPHFSTPGAKATDFSKVLCPSAPGCTLVDLTPKYPTLVATTPGWRTLLEGERGVSAAHIFGRPKSSRGWTHRLPVAKRRPYHTP